MKQRAKFALLFTVFIDLLGFGIVIPILPLYAKNISANPSPWMIGINQWFDFSNPGAFWAGLAMVSFTSMQFVATPILGRWSDKIGRRPLLYTSLMGSALGYLVLGLTMRYEWVIAARILDGLTGGNIAVAQAAMADISTPEDRSKSLGMMGAAFGMGFVLGPALAGILSGSSWGNWLLEAHGLHLPFLVASVMSLIASLSVLFFLPETLSAENREKTKHKKRGHAILQALKRPQMPTLLLISLLTVTGFGMFEGSFALMTNQRFGFGQKEVGYLFGVVGLLIAIYQGAIVRIISKLISEQKLLVLGLTFLIIGFVSLPIAPLYWPFYLCIIPAAWGSGMNNTSTFALASKLTPPEDQGSLFGVLGAVQSLGRILGPAIGTLAFAQYGYRMPFHVAVGFIVLALGAAVALLSAQPNNDSNNSRHP